MTRVLAFRICCEACGDTSRIPPDCDLYATWATVHTLPGIRFAEVVIDGAYMIRAVRPA